LHIRFSMLSFDCTEVAFKGKSDAELSRAVLLFRLLSNPFLVNVGTRLTSFLLNFGFPIKGLIKRTIFQQFVGGETRDSSMAKINWLAERKVGSILDYSVEGKKTDQGFEETTLEIIECITTAANSTSTPFAVFKVSGLVTEQVLIRQSLQPNEEDPEWQKLKLRLHRILGTASEKGVPIMIDAEESWLQTAIDRLAEKAFQEYNLKRPLVYTTLQMYRKDRLEYLFSLWQKAEKHGFFPGVKLVRGAYMEKERLRAAEFNYPDPIQISKLNTDRDFNLALDFVAENIHQGALVLGTHNEESCLRLVERMQQFGLSPSHERICFSQLLGMSDHISFNLAQAGYKVAKYVPYGPVNELLPYLQRRAAENTSVQGQTGRELSLLYTEFQRRRSQKKNQS